MGFEIRKDESDATLRRIPIFLQKPDGSGQNDLTGITIFYREPGAAADVDRTADYVQMLGSPSRPGRGYLQLGLTDIDTSGVGWVGWTGLSILSNDDWVLVNPNPSSVLARLPAALTGGGFIKASVEEVAAGQLAAIAQGVWATALVDARVAGSMGDLIQFTAALHQGNVVLDQTVFGANALLTFARGRGFASAAAAAAAVAGAANNANGEIFRWTVSAVDGGSSQWTSLKLVRTL